MLVRHPETGELICQDCYFAGLEAYLHYLSQGKDVAQWLD